MRTLTIAVSVLVAVSALPALADVSIDAPRISLSLRDNGTWASLIEKPSGRECCRPDATQPFASVTVEGKSYSPESVTPSADGFRVTFAGVDTVLNYAVEPAEEWIAFRLTSVEGARPTNLLLMRVPASVTANVGSRLNCAWDEDTSVCLMAANTQVSCRATGQNGPLLSASTQDFPGPQLEGAAAALIACPTPEFKAIARNASNAFGLLTNEDADGTPVKDTDLVRGSYFFLSFGEQDVDTVIDYCKKAGIKQVMMGSGSWCKSVGHYLFSETRYPDGKESLKRVVDKLHENGILVGMHTFVSKVSKIDPYVSPVPDPRFWRQFETKLASNISAEQTEIKVVAGMPLTDWAGSSKTATKYWEGGVAKHREVIIGDEIIQYESVGPEGTWDTFYGCKRGAWNSSPGAHQAGDVAVHFGVDGCIDGYIIDQETDLMDEVAERIAGIFNDCGFDMVYFDGGEDVDTRRFSYYVSNFQAQAMSRFTRRPVIHMGTIMTHRLWHSFARSSTVDTYLNTLGGAIIGGRGPDKWLTVKDHINTSVRYMLSVSADMMPGELGWFGIWPKGSRGYVRQLTDKEYETFEADGYAEWVRQESECAVTASRLKPPNQLEVSVEYDGLQLDEIEYLMCKSMAYDAAVSLQTSFGSMEAHPLTPEILRIFKTYENLRMNRLVPDDVRARIGEMDRDFALVNLDGQRHFVEVERVPVAGGDRRARALVGAFRDGAVATLWHTDRDGTLTIDIDPDEASLLDFDGAPVEFRTDNGRCVIPLDGTRNTLICKSLSPDALAETLNAATVWERPPTMVFVQAHTATELVGKMALGSDVGVDEPEAFGDVLVCTGAPALGKVNGWYAEYTVDIPHEGIWTLWARVKYPTGGDMSFGIVRPGEELTLSGAQVLGNCGVNQKQWHWTGRGGGSTTVPPGQPITFKLEQGPFTFRIYGREGSGSAATNPRLDLICLVDEWNVLPTDDDAREHLTVE